MIRIIRLLAVRFSCGLYESLGAGEFVWFPFS